MLKQLGLLILSIALVASVTFAQPLVPDQSSNSFINSVTEGSAGSSDSTNYHSDYIGDDLANYVMGSSLEACLGSWCPIFNLPVVAEYSMKIGGQITYSNSTAIPNSDIVVSAKDAKTSLIYSANAKTDAGGNFNAQIDNIPKSLLDNGYSVSIRVVSVIEASYEHLCTYNSGSNKWLC